MYPAIYIDFDSIVTSFSIYLHVYNTILLLQYKNAEGISEQLKADNQMDWVCKINNIRERVNEIIYKELICI